MTNLGFAADVAARADNDILGHASDVRGRYGRKGGSDPQIAAKIEALEPPVIKQMSTIWSLQRHELTLVSSWCLGRTEFEFPSRLGNTK